MQYLVAVPPKMLRESLCVAQTLLGLSEDSRKQEHIEVLQRLIDECDRHRPLGPDGKHGDRHTPTCGCEDKNDSIIDEKWVQNLIELDWHSGSLFAKRCKARLEQKGDQPYYGRCELVRHSESIDHALERGMIWVRWNTRIVWEQPQYK